MRINGDSILSVIAPPPHHPSPAHGVGVQTGVKTTVGLTNFTSSKSSFGSINHNKKSSNLSFQDSRTPFSKRLEMLRQGISSKPSLIIPGLISSERSHDKAELSHDTSRVKEKNGKVQENTSPYFHSNNHIEHTIHLQKYMCSSMEELFSFL